MERQVVILDENGAPLLHSRRAQIARDGTHVTITLFPDDDDCWRQYRISDLKASIAHEEGLGRQTALLYAAKRALDYLETQVAP